MLSLSLCGLPDGQENRGRIKFHPAHPYSHLCRRSGRSPALPYPPHRSRYSIMFNPLDSDKSFWIILIFIWARGIFGIVTRGIFGCHYDQIPPRDGHPCRPANSSPCRACRGLSPPSGCALPGAQVKKGVGKIANPLIFLARPERFELPTHGFVVRCSIQLSYGRIVVNVSALPGFC